jgi:hypothetical protein
MRRRRVAAIRRRKKRADAISAGVGVVWVRCGGAFVVRSRNGGGGAAVVWGMGKEVRVSVSLEGTRARTKSMAAAVGDEQCVGFALDDSARARGRKEREEKNGRSRWSFSEAGARERKKERGSRLTLENSASCAGVIS